MPAQQKKKKRKKSLIKNTNKNLTLTFNNTR